MFRRDSNISTASFVSDVEMARDEVFAGPMSESVPSSITGFAHRRTRADSRASFTFYPDAEESTGSAWPDDEAVMDDDELSDEGPMIRAYAGPDLESGQSSSPRRKSSGYWRASAEDSLLHRLDSSKTDASGHTTEGRTNQKIYIVTEDLTVVFAGFNTSRFGSALYLILCIFSLGLAYLFLRWMPRWKVRLVGIAAALKHCSWVIVEV